MELEVIIQNGEEAKQAEKMGADRLELVSAMEEGGLTPSFGTIKQVLSRVTIPVFVMVRPHNYHYSYQETDIEIILEDINRIIELGGTRIVFGALNVDLTVNERLIEQVINTYPNIIITFHRAFDEVKCQIEAYKTLARYKENIKYILTSGAATNCLEGKGQLRELVNLSRDLDGPQIMPGAGLNADNINHIHNSVEAAQYHFGSAVRVNQCFANTYDPAIMKKIRNILDESIEK